MHSIGFAEVEQALLREVWVELDLVDHRMNTSSGQQAPELWTREVGHP